MGSKKNVKIPRVINVPKIGGLTALNALGSLTNGIAAIAKTIHNARMAKEDTEEKKRYNKKIESVAVGEGLCLIPIERVMVSIFNSIVGGKDLKIETTNFSATQYTTIKYRHYIYCKEIYPTF